MKSAVAAKKHFGCSKGGIRQRELYLNSEMDLKKKSDVCDWNKELPLPVLSRMQWWNISRRQLGNCLKVQDVQTTVLN